MLVLNVLVRKCNTEGRNTGCTSEKAGVILYSLYKTSVLLEGILTSPQARKRLNITFILKSGRAVFFISIVNKENILRKPLKNTR